MIIIFWIAIISFIAPNSEPGYLVSKQLPSISACRKILQPSETEVTMREFVEFQGNKITAAYCVPVTDNHREPIAGGAPV